MYITSLIFNLLALLAFTAADSSLTSRESSAETSSLKPFRDFVEHTVTKYGTLRKAAFARRQSSDSSSNSESSSGGCPQVWHDIATDLKSTFLGCNGAARTAIRFAFHDAAGYSSRNTPSKPASGGADGSLLLSETEVGRSMNNPMQNFRDTLFDKYNKYKNKGVGAADFVQAASNLAIRSCSGGPKVKTVIGRGDTSDSPPEGTLPLAFGPGSDHGTIVKLFADMGINQRELAALMGAHTVSRSFAQTANGVAANSPQDSTPSTWDTKYFSETQASTSPRGVARFDSDVNLAQRNTTSGQAFTEFANDKGAWTSAYQDAAYKLSLLGVDEETRSKLIDCTEILD